MARGDHRDGVGIPSGLQKTVQSDYRGLLAHVTTGSLAAAASLVLAGLFHLGGAGPAGAPGSETVITRTGQAGLCTYFGKDATGITRFQVSEPYQDANGLYCLQGKLVSVTPIKK